MFRIVFQRIAPDEARIYRDGDYVGDLYLHDDILVPGSSYYVIHLDEDPRGPKRVHERARVRDTAQHLVDTHPLLS